MTSLNRFKLSLLALFCVITLGGTACAQQNGNLLLGIMGQLVQPVSQQEEVQAGAKLDESVRKQYPVSTDAALQAYVSQVGQRLAATSKNSYPFHYTVLQDDKTVNAFAGPGGYIYITTGLLRIMDNEAQLAGVLAHETAHVTQRHIVGQLQKQTATQLGISLLDRMTQLNLNNTISRIGQTLLFQRFSRQDERQADIVGLQYMVDAGYNPQGMVQILNKLGQANPRGLSIPFLQSHPNSQQRSKEVAALIQRNKLERPGQILNTSAFQAVKS